MQPTQSPQRVRERQGNSNETGGRVLLPSVWRGSGLGRWGRTRTESKGRWGTEDGEGQETENGGRRKTERDEQEDGLWRRQDGWRQLNELRHPPSFRPSSNLTIGQLPPLTTSLYSSAPPTTSKLVVHPVVHPGRQNINPQPPHRVWMDRACIHKPPDFVRQQISYELNYQQQESGWHAARVASWLYYEPNLGIWMILCLHGWKHVMISNRSFDGW